MNKKLALKIFLRNPLKMIKHGILEQEQDFYKRKLLAEYGICQLPTIDILDIFPNLDENISYYSYLTGTSLVTDIVLLKMLARKFTNGSYLEIGSWRGESIANVSDILSDCISVTLSEEEMRSMKFSEGFIKVHGIFSKNKKIKQIGHNSKTFDFSSLNKKFDLVFIDGDHSYSGILNDTKKVFPLLKDKNSNIVWHDFTYGTEDTRYTTLKAILDGTPKEYHENLFHVSNTMCAILLNDNGYKTTYTEFPSYPNKEFSITIKGKRL